MTASLLLCSTAHPWFRESFIIPGLLRDLFNFIPLIRVLVLSCPRQIFEFNCVSPCPPCDIGNHCTRKACRGVFSFIAEFKFACRWQRHHAVKRVPELFCGS
ncbi:hypothetical protein LZ32DRAFT_66499 [Colletotrichum eremochloae]|nr:hypothetical protein LZ32DRAFT_66499 [Colletotrichum eremochloae]